MKICNLCKKEFNILIMIEGKVRNLGSRKYCLECSPFGTGNRKDLMKKKEFRCRECGAAHEHEFYATKRGKCGKCHNKEMHALGKLKRNHALDKLGNKCSSCGYDKYKCSLDIHHLDPSKKDKDFASMRSWSIKRIDKEIEACTLLCRNCHFALHNGFEVTITGGNSVW